MISQKFQASIDSFHRETMLVQIPREKLEFTPDISNIEVMSILTHAAR